MSCHKITRGKGDIDFVAIQKLHLWKSEYCTVPLYVGLYTIWDRLHVSYLECNTVRRGWLGMQVYSVDGSNVGK